MGAQDLLLGGIVVPGPAPTTTPRGFRRTLDLRWGRNPPSYAGDRRRYPLRGHRTYLNPHMVRRAVDAIDDFVAGPRGPRDRLLVHCYHGVNRTGAVVAAWLRRHGVDLPTAVDLFARVRGQAPRPELVAWLARHDAWWAAP